MKKLAFLLILATAPAFAGEPPNASGTAALAPDLDKPVTTTLRKLQAIVSAATANGQAQCAARAAEAEMQDLIKQATPAAKP